jgi:hypothetical protein
MKTRTRFVLDTQSGCPEAKDSEKMTEPAEERGWLAPPGEQHADEGENGDRCDRLDCLTHELALCV